MEKEKIQDLAVFYYSRKDIQEAIFKFCQNRETIPRYYEGFGKRPDSLEYPADILQQVKKGATSFHCSEELWNNPMEISTELNKEQLNNLRQGWDLLIDIDCKYFDYSKKAVLSIVKALRHEGIKNIGIKFSGGKGFHIIVPWQAFPEEIHNPLTSEIVKTKEMFPEYPRILCEYLKFISRDILEKEILESGEEYKKLGEAGIKCKNCGNLAETFYQIEYFCGRCKISETIRSREIKERKCPQCRKDMLKKNEKEFFYCQKCKIDSLRSKENFSSSIDIFKILGLDLVLVSPRHLFRAPYSLHEKTGFVSVVLDETEIENFQPKDADIMKIKIRDFLPQAEKDEAKKLLINALEWHGEKERNLEKDDKHEEKRAGKKFQEIQIDKSSMNYPPAIKKILEGMEDGKKRALFILLNFFRSLNFTREETEKKINEWNDKNPKKLKEGYIIAQMEWTFRQKKMLPPNYDKPFYRDIGILPDEEEMRLKNPVSYVIRKSKWLKEKK